MKARSTKTAYDSPVAKHEERVEAAWFGDRVGFRSVYAKDRVQIQIPDGATLVFDQPPILLSGASTLGCEATYLEEKGGTLEFSEEVRLRLVHLAIGECAQVQLG